MARPFVDRHPYLSLLAVLALMLPPLLVGLGNEGPGDMESLAVTSSQETWLNLHAGDAAAWIIPSLNGRPRIVKPPLLVWMNLLAWIDLDPQSSTPDQLLLRARCVTVACSVVIVCAVFAIGRMLGGTRLALLAALAAALNLMGEEAARRASYDMHVAMWSALCVACGCWAVQPGMAISFSRAGLRWGLAGVAMALAVLTKGPVAFLFTAMPLALIAVCSVGLRRRAFAGLLVAVLVSLALIAPWYAHLLATIPRAAGDLFREYKAQGLPDRKNILYYPSRLIRHANPWSVWLVAGLLLPLLTTYRRRIPAAVVAPLCLSITVVVLSMVSSVEERYIVPALAALALTCAFGLHLGMPDPAPVASTWRDRLLPLVHWVTLAACAIGPINHAINPPGDGHVLAPQWLVVLVAATLTVLCIAGGIQSWKRPSLPWLAGLTAIWAVTFHTWLWFDRSIQPDRDDRSRDAANQVIAAVGSAPVSYLRLEYRDGPGYEFLFYSRRVIPPIKDRDLARIQADGAASPSFILARISDDRDHMLREAGYEHAMNFNDASGRGESRLWRRGKATP